MVTVGAEIDRFATSARRLWSVEPPVHKFSEPSAKTAPVEKASHWTWACGWWSASACSLDARAVALCVSLICEPALPAHAVD